MKKGKLGKLWAVICAAMACVMVFSLAACNDGGDKDALTLNKTSVEVEVGKTVEVQVTSAETEDILWTTDNPAIAAVTATSGQGNKICTVYGTKAGTATLTATTGEKTATCAVTVKAAQGGQETTETVTIKYGDAAVGTDAYILHDAGDKITFTATASKGSAITWETSASAVATVSGGVVTAVAAGEATITAKVSDSVKATVKVKVLEGTAIPFNDNKIDGWSYWDGNRYGWPNGDGVVSSAVSYENGDAKITYSASDTTCPWTVQLRYNDAQYTGTSHDVTLTLVASVSGKLMVNEQEVEVTANTPVPVDVKGYATQALYVQMGVSDPVSVLTGTNVTVSITNVVYKSNVTVDLKAPTFAIAAETNVITITDEQNEATNVGQYVLGFFETAEATAPVKTVVVTTNTAVDTATVASGNYTLRIRAINSGDILVRDSAWSTQTLAFEVKNPTTPIDATTTSGWYYDLCGGISSVENAYQDSEEAIHIEGLEQSDKPYAFQLKINTTKKITSVTVTVTAENAGYLSFCNPAGTQYEKQISAGTETFTAPDLDIEGTLVICFADNSSWWGHQDQDPVWLLGDVVLSINITYAN